MRIDQQQKRVVADWLAFKREHVHCVAAQKHAEATNERVRPFFLAHFVTTRIEPHHIPDFRTSNPPALEKFRTTKDRVISPELNQFLGESKQLILLFIALPIKPTDLIVLAISVIVSVLRPAPFVAAAVHRLDLLKKQSRKNIPMMKFAMRDVLHVFGRHYVATLAGV